tara:strand:+ start:54 stop:197 length:144 start_codon:yes stop_codon:yes gene_type:complete
MSPLLAGFVLRKTIEVLMYSRTNTEVEERGMPRPSGARGEVNPAFSM